MYIMQEFADGRVNLRVPWDIYSRRPATNGAKLEARHADALTRMFQRNLGVMHTRQFAEVCRRFPTANQRRMSLKRSLFGAVSLLHPHLSGCLRHFSRRMGNWSLYVCKTINLEIDEEQFNILINVPTKLYSFFYFVTRNKHILLLLLLIIRRRESTDRQSVWRHRHASCPSE